VKLCTVHYMCVFIYIYIMGIYVLTSVSINLFYKYLKTKSRVLFCRDKSAFVNHV
jgi:hypothetical protein